VISVENRKKNFHPCVFFALANGGSLGIGYRRVASKN